MRSISGCGIIIQKNRVLKDGMDILLGRVGGSTEDIRRFLDMNARSRADRGTQCEFLPRPSVSHLDGCPF